MCKAEISILPETNPRGCFNGSCFGFLNSNLSRCPNYNPQRSLPETTRFDLARFRPPHFGNAHFCKPPFFFPLETNVSIQPTKSSNGWLGNYSFPFEMVSFGGLWFIFGGVFWGFIVFQRVVVWGETSIILDNPQQVKIPNIAIPSRNKYSP